jgi:hypothetical protein
MPVSRYYITTHDDHELLSSVLDTDELPSFGVPLDDIAMMKITVREQDAGLRCKACGKPGKMRPDGMCDDYCLKASKQKPKPFQDNNKFYNSPAIMFGRCGVKAKFWG